MDPEVRGRRLAWIDTARGIGIVLVVLGHTISGVSAAGLLSGGGFVHALYSAIYAFHMPLFFVLAGRTFNVREGVIRRRAEVLLYPYVVWSLLQGGLTVLAPWAANDRLTPATFAMRLLTDPIGQFWFLPVLFAMCVLGAVAKERLPWVAAGLFLVTFCDPIFAHIGYVARSTCRNLPFFAFGMTKWHPRSFWWVLGLIVVWVFRDWHVLPSWFLLPATCGILATIVLSERLESAVLVQLGRWSLVIYLAHVLVAAAARFVLVRLGLRDGGLHVLFGTMAGIAGSALLAWLRDQGHAEWLFTPPWPARVRIMVRSDR